MATLLLFGILSQIAGTKSEVIEAPCLGDLLQAASTRFGERFRKALSHCTVAIDGQTLEEIDPRAPVKDSSEVALLPPVSGGSTDPGPDETPIRMADVGDKPKTLRSATARCTILASETTLDAIVWRKLPKGDAIAAAKLAGILGAKLAPQIVPLCHPVSIGFVDIQTKRESPTSLLVEATVTGEDRTGFEMEALCAAVSAALTIYDMSKSIEPSIEIDGLHLVAKSGGKSGEWKSNE